VLLSSDADDTLVQMPDIALARWLPLQAPGILWPELLGPAANGFVRNGDTTLGQQFFDQPQAEREAKIQPDGLGKDLWRIAMALVADRQVHAVPDTSSSMTVG
jgi:hypothetical protein